MIQCHECDRWTDKPVVVESTKLAGVYCQHCYDTVIKPELKTLLAEVI